MQFRLIAGSSRPAPSQGTDVYLDLWDIPEGAFSLPALMTQNLLQIRAEHAAWAYDTAHVSVSGHDTLSETLQGGSPLSMWWCSQLYERHPKVSPTLYDIYRLRALELLLEDKGATALEAVGCSQRIVRTLELFCQATGRAFSDKETVTDAAGKSRVRRLYDAIPAPVRALIRFGYWLATVKRLLKRTGPLPSSERQTGTVATYFPNIDLKLAAQGRFKSRYWEKLHDALARDAGEGKNAAVRWLFIRFPSPQGSLAQCLKFRDDFLKAHRDGISFHYLEEFLGGGDMLSCLGRWGKIARAAFKAEKTIRPHFAFKGSHLNLWPMLGWEYYETFAGWRCLERCLQQKGIENYVREAGPQRWYTFPLENCAWERMLTHAVHTQKMGPVYGAQHSTIRPTDFRFFDDPRTWTDKETRVFQPDIVAGNGHSAFQQWKDAGVPADRLQEIEALRYLYLAKTRENARPWSGEKRILVLTSFFADETDAHLQLVAKAFLAGILDGWDITVKPHPYLPVEEKLKALLGDKARGLRFSMEPLPKELAASPLVWASNSTTAALEAVIQGLPVLVMQPSGDFDLCPLQDVPGLARTSSVESVREALAAAAPLQLDPGYLCLDPELPRWCSLLQLQK